MNVSKFHESEVSKFQRKACPHAQNATICAIVIPSKSGNPLSAYTIDTADADLSRRAAQL
jgi:hypothetical protein